MYSALIFDLDGTLWDSTASVSEAWAEAVKELSEALPKVTPKEVSLMMGMTTEEIFKTFFPQLPVERQKVFSEVLLAKQRQVLNAQNGVLFPGVRRGLEVLKKHYPLFIVSNCHVPYIEMFFDQNPLKDHFVDWECYGRTGKPKADNILSVIKKHKIQSAAYMGDTASDQKAAQKAGIDFYHAAYGFGEPDEDCVRFRGFKEAVDFFVGLK